MKFHHRRQFRTFSTYFVLYFVIANCAAMSISSSKSPGTGLSSIGLEEVLDSSEDLDHKSAAPGSVSAVVGSAAFLPCNITPNDGLLVGGGDDFITLILWYKDDVGGAPIYTVDSRTHPVETARHFPSEFLEGRSTFDLSVQPSLLKLSSIAREDDGLYKCRVDYRRGRTSYTSTFLSVIVPPQRVVILDGARQEFKNSKAGPFEEEAKVTMTCRAEGGRPPPTLHWFKDNVLVDDTFSVVNEGPAGLRPNLVVENRLLIGKLVRADLNSVLTCRAINGNVTTVVTGVDNVEASVTLDINLRPSAVDILSVKDHISAGRKLEVTCQSYGSRPPAQITWTKNKKRLEHSRESFSLDGNLTTSVLVFVPTKEDDGGQLTCSSENLRLENSTISANWSLKVYYDPKVTLSMGTSSKLAMVREGERAQMDCSVAANPPETSRGWFFNGEKLKKSENIVMSNESLVITRTSRAESGKYQCWAQNVEGRALSNVLQLEAHYAPTCKASQKAVYGASIGETVAVSCDVDGSPTQIMFFWVFNRTHLTPTSSSSSENSSTPLTLTQTSIQVTSSSSPKLKYASEGTRSWLYFTPSSRFDFGSFECWGRNVIGRQEEPCIFHVLPAGPPEPVQQCFVANATASALTISCSPGYDGGLRQAFFLEVYEYKREQLVSNVSKAEVPRFAINGLSPDTPYVLVVYSANSKGKSGRITLTSQTETIQLLKLNKDLAEKSASFMEAALMPLLGVASGLVLTLLLVAVIVVFIVRIRKQEEGSERGSMSRANSSKFDKANPGNSSEESLSLEAKLLPSLSSPTSPRNPDVIPSLGIGLSESGHPRYEVDPLFRSGIKGAFLEGDPYSIFPTPISDLMDTDSYGLDPGGEPLDIAALRHQTQLRYQEALDLEQFEGSDPSTRKYESDNHNVLEARTLFRPPTTIGASQVDIAASYLSQTLPRRPSAMVTQDLVDSVSTPHRSTHSLGVSGRSAGLFEMSNAADMMIPLQTVSTINRRMNRRGQPSGSNISGFSTPV